MDQYSILDTASVLSPPPQSSGRARPEPPRSARYDLRFPGDDGGQSLAAWARRDLEATLQLLADRAQYITGASGAAIALRDGEHIICRASSGPSAPEVGSFLEVSSGLSGESVRTRTIMRCDDADQDSRVNREGCRQLGIASFVVMPLVRNDDVVGIFELFGSTPNAFQERDIAALERMGEMVNTALDQVSPACSKTNASQAHGEADQEASPAAMAAVALESSPTTSQAQSADEDEIVLSIDDDPATSDAPARLSAAMPVAPPATVTTAQAVPSAEPVSVQKPFQRQNAIRNCAACGFPVSEGRTLCLDCEASPEHASIKGGGIAGAPAFLTSLSDESSQAPGLKNWLSTHKYLLGTIAVVGSTVAILIFR